MACCLYYRRHLAVGADMHTVQCLVSQQLWCCQQLSMYVQRVRIRRDHAVSVLGGVSSTLCSWCRLAAYYGAINMPSITTIAALPIAPCVHQPWCFQDPHSAAAVP